MSETLRNLSTIEYGASPKEIRSIDYTPIGIYGTGGLVGSAIKALFHGPLVVVARKGTLDNPIYVSGDCWVIDTAYAVLPNSGVDAKWLYYNLSKYDLKKLNESTGVPSISRDYLYRVTFETFSLPEQRKIARILATVDAVIEKTEAAIAKYKAIKSGMMRDLFTRGIDLKTGKLRPRYEDAPELYKESELGRVPREWEVVRIGDFGNVITGYTPSTKRDDLWVGTNSFYSPADFDDDKLFCDKTERQISDYALNSERCVYQNSILFTCIASIGKIAIAKHEGITNQQINSINVNSNNDFSFVYYALINLRGRIIAKTPQTTIPIINKGDFEIEKVLRPKLEEQKHISKILYSTDCLLEKLSAELTKHQQLKQALMSDLLTGKVRVKYEEEKVEAA